MKRYEVVMSGIVLGPTRISFGGLMSIVPLKESFTRGDSIYVGLNMK